MLVSFQNVSFGFEGSVLFSDVDFSVSEGEKIGLVGGNGEGKTTLLRLILSKLSPESGEIFKKNGMRVGYLEQNGGFDSSRTVFEEMHALFSEDEKAISDLREMESRLSSVEENSIEYRELAQKYDRLTRFVDSRDSYHVEVKIRTVLNGLGFSSFYDHVISTMSGGEKTRLKLCKLLLEEPDLLILDEPTNHLDIQTLFWLEEYLSSYRGALLVVSHDRYFLDRTVQKIFDLERGKLTVYTGNYTKYKRLKEEATARAQKEFDKQQVEIAHLNDYIARNRVRATTAKMAQSRIKQLDKMEKLDEPKTPVSPPSFSFTFETDPAKEVLTFQDYCLTVEDKALFSHADFTLLRGEKCALIGENGTGKSTLIKQIYAHTDEKIRLGRFVKIGYYDQENANLDPNNTVLAELWGRHVLWSQTDVRKLLARSGLFAEDTEKKVRSLSGGERAKLALAVFSAENGNFLLLDEPTNHLDLPAREALEKALKDYQGTILFVSHDRYFISAVAGKIAEIKDKRLTVFDGTYEAFCEKKRSSEPIVRNEPSEKTVKSETREAPVAEVKSYRSKEERANDAKKKERARQIEKELESLEAEEKKITEELSTSEVSANYALLKEKCDRLEEIKQRTDELYEEYETL